MNEMVYKKKGTSEMDMNGGEGEGVLMRKGEGGLRLDPAE